MALWLYRTGKYGEHEQKFLTYNRIYLTWQGLENRDLTQVKDYNEIKQVMREVYPDVSNQTLGNYSGQIWAFVLAMKPNDWVVVPLKSKPAIAVGEITSELICDATAQPPYQCWREVKWMHQEVPRSAFAQDLLYSFGAIQTICNIQRNDAEKRIRQMAQNNWVAAPLPVIVTTQPNSEGQPVEQVIDLERLGRDQIAKLIIQKFKGHGMERLVQAILQAQGYTTYRSPEGADRGVDLLAAPGPLGFGRPRICVQVKSHDAPVDRPTLDQLIGTMQNVQADQGLLVSWGGFTRSIDRELASQFFRVRLWDQDALINALLEHYHQLDEDLRAEVPLKRIWTMAIQDAEE